MPDHPQENTDLDSALEAAAEEPIEEEEQAEDDIKMMIVMRRDLRMRKGKIAAQAGHACVQATLDALSRLPEDNPQEEQEAIEERFPFLFWLNHGQKKVCVYVDGEDALLNVYRSLEARGIHAALIQDAGHTEFHGEPTLTCLATEPRAAADLDPVTGVLPLY